MKFVTLGGKTAPRNPRIFRKRVRRADKDIRPGEVVGVRDGTGRFLGRGFYNPASQIAVRILDREETDAPLDAMWFRRRLERSARMRTDVAGLPHVTDSWRVVFSEGDELSGLIVDKYADVAVIDIGARGMFERLDFLEDEVKRVTGVDRIVVRADARNQEIEGFSVNDPRAAPVRTTIEEHGIRFHVDCRVGHKTGFFLDQRDARNTVQGIAEGRRVLDLCCYTGGFALAAARGGAKSVVGVDLDEDAIAMAKENAVLNELDMPTFEHADTFDYLRTKPRADLIVLDPPKLTSSPDGLRTAWNKSVDFHALAFAALKPGGLLFTFCCTGLIAPHEFQRQAAEGAARAGCGARILDETRQPVDHPVHLFCPETRYLTGLLIEVT